jgi:hypothetical protein
VSERGYESEEDFDEDDLDAELAETTIVHCPYCGEAIEMIVDPSGGEVQEYVEDCEVCCQPWSVRVTIGGDGVPFVEVEPLDG